MRMGVEIPDGECVPLFLFPQPVSARAGGGDRDKGHRRRVLPVDAETAVRSLDSRAGDPRGDERHGAPRTHTTKTSSLSSLRTRSKPCTLPKP